MLDFQVFLPVIMLLCSMSQHSNEFLLVAVLNQGSEYANSLPPEHHTSGMDRKEIGLNVRNWVYLAQDRDYWRALVNVALNLLSSISHGVS